MNPFALTTGSVHTIYLTPEQYLLEPAVTRDGAWSLALNILASFRLSDFMTGNVALFMEYQDLRGKHRLPVDFTELDFESAILFSNLVQMPIRGRLYEVSLKLVGVTAGVEVETELLQIQHESQRSYVKNQPMSKTS